MALIRMVNVTKTYDLLQGPVLEDINLEVEKDDFIFIVGPSGCGKTTLIKLLIRELFPTKGEIYIGNQNIVKMRSSRVPYLRRSIGCVFQDFKLLSNKTAYENVAFALRVIGQSEKVVRTQVTEVLSLVGLEERMQNYPHELSGGEQQRISIARAFVNRPPLLLADEPTGNLDPSTSMGIMSILDKINKTGTTVLVATHDREIVDSMRKRVIALEAGKTVRDQDRGVYGYED